MGEEQKGLVIIHTGPGKGKTTAAFGLCLRSAGRGYKSRVIQFLKGGDRSGELLACEEYLQKMVEIHTYGREGFIGGEPLEEDYDMAEEALEKAREVLNDPEVGLVILDEVNVAVSLGLLGVNEVLELLKEKPEDKHVVLTGREAHRKLIEIADTVTVFDENKHHFSAGVSAVEGIEY
ncbi:Cob(I)yrinic acid a,c-diamide adenosyltransferase [Natranaerofaba carboxydovora]|nr:Cob(I)yrinic acid a,c-diamide adenosyltransferase [Natranaerofaba carboxydovora]